MTLSTRLSASVGRVRQEIWALGHVSRAGGLRPMPVRPLGAMSQAIGDYGPVGAAVSVAALRHGERTALIDDRGPVQCDRQGAQAAARHRLPGGAAMRTFRRVRSGSCPDVPQWFSG